MQIVTNNPKVLSSYPGVRWVPGGPLEVLIESRNRVQAGFALLIHPLMGDIHLLGNPFRSVILADEKEDVHLTSLRWIEESIEKIRHHSPKSKAVRGLEDYQEVDFELVQTAIRGDL
jgi:hypothetical protein